MRYESFPSAMEDSSSGEFSSYGPDHDRQNINGDMHTPDIQVRVKKPRSLRSTEDNNSYTVYDIIVETTEEAFRLKRSKAIRRFSEFDWLRKRLCTLDKWRSPPELPPKRFFLRHDDDFIESRRAGLENWLTKILSDPFYLSDMGLHLFLQTEWSLQEIQDYLNGKVPEAAVEELFENYGKKYPYMPHNLLHYSYEPQQPQMIVYSPGEESNARPITLDDDPAVVRESDFVTRATERGKDYTPDSGCFDFATTSPVNVDSGAEGATGTAAPKGDVTNADDAKKPSDVMQMQSRERQIAVDVHACHEKMMDCEDYNQYSDDSRYCINGDTEGVEETAS